MSSDTDSKGSSIRVTASITLMLFIISVGLGYLEAGARGAAAGAVAAAAAELLSWLGFIPVIGQILYILLWDKVASWVTGLVPVKYAVVVPYYVGLVESIIVSVAITIIILGAIVMS